MANKGFLLISFILVSLITLLTPIEAQNEDSTSTVQHLVLEFSGNPEISRESSQGIFTDPQPVSPGIFVGPRDVFFIPNGDTRVIVLCADDTVVEVTQDISVAPCSEAVSPNPTFVYGDETIYRSSRRSGGTAVYTLFPRNTVLLDEPNEFVWQAYEPTDTERDATITYHVELVLRTTNGTESLFETIVSETRFVIPEDGIPDVQFTSNLPNGDNAIYQIVVRPLADGMETGDEDPYLPQGFCILDPRLDTTIEDRIQEINDLTSDSLSSSSLSDVRNYYLGLYFFSQGLYAEAEEFLSRSMIVMLDENLSDEQIEENTIAVSPAFYILIARTYDAMRLPQLSQLAYQQALAIARELGDLYSEAFILQLMGDLARGGSSIVVEGQAAYTYYSDSIETYEQIGDMMAADNVRENRDESISSSPDAGPCSRTR